MPSREIHRMENDNVEEMEMMKHALKLLVIVALSVIPSQCAWTFPIGFSGHGGIGMGYYSMKELNDHINITGQTIHTSFPDLSNGINLKFEGRVWFFDRFAVTGGYEHYYGDTEGTTETATLMFKAPANVYTVGGVLKVFSLPVFVDLHIGGYVCFARSVYGTNEEGSRRLAEFKGNDNGYQLFAEAATNFIRPLEFGIQLGYRGLKVKSFEDRYGDIAYFPTTRGRIQLDYSGVFFYVTVGFRI